MNNHECPVCRSTTALFDVVDFNKTCLPLDLPLSGVPVYYSRCPNCHFVFAQEFQAWSDGNFLDHIYNDDYVQVDPDYVSARPAANAGWIGRAFGAQRAHPTHLDYGGGNGALSDILKRDGWNSSSYDPFPRNEAALESLGKFDFITAFEVFEHVPDVASLMHNLTSLMAERCLIVFSTLLVDGNVKEKERLNWWYAAPRNGHISLFSRASLKRLAEQNNLMFGSFSDGVHCFFNQLPTWAESIVK